MGKSNIENSPLSLILLLKLIFVSSFITTILPAYAAEDFSEINKVLFDSAHMKGLTEPGTLNYQYQKTNEGEVNRKDKIRVNVTKIAPSGRSDQSYDFFTGKHKRPYLERSDILGNAIFMLFLEWDIHELQRQTKGSWRHFQRRIRWAMAEDPKKEDIEITLSDGKKIQGIQYKIQPYAEDKNSERYGEQVNKYYIFTLSDAIPGRIYEVRTIVPKAKSWKEGDKLLSEERVTFSSFNPSSS